MPGYLIQSLNSVIDLMIQHKYKNWIEVWRFFVRTLLLSVRFSSEICFLSEIFPSEVSFLSECCSFCVSEISFFLSDFLQKSSSFCQISLRNLLIFVRFPWEISFFLSEISFFLSDFLQKSPSFYQKSPFHQVSLRNFLSVRFLSEISSLSVFP